MVWREFIVRNSSRQQRPSVLHQYKLRNQTLVLGALEFEYLAIVMNELEDFVSVAGTAKYPARENCPALKGSRLSDSSLIGGANITDNHFARANVRPTT